MNSYDLPGLIIEHNVGDSVTVKYYRGGNYSTVKIILEQRPANTVATLG